MSEPNPVKGFTFLQTDMFKRDAKPYKHIKKRILNTALQIVGYPEKVYYFHSPLSGKCRGMFHARVDQNLRVIYRVDYDKQIVYLERLLPHREMEKYCR